MRRTPRLLCALTAATLVIAGCGNADEGSLEATDDSGVESTAPETTGASGLGEPAAMVRGAAEATAEHGSVTSEMVMRMDGEEAMRTEGVFSNDSLTGRSTVSMPGMEFEMLMVDGDYFYKYPSMPPGVEWITMSGGDLTGLTGVDPSAAPGADMSPTASLDMLTAVADDVEELGTDELFGVTVHGYRASVPVETMIEQGLETGLFTEEYTEQARALMPDGFEIDLWIDEDGLPRRQSWEMEMSMMGESATFAYQIDFSEWGAPLELSAPPAESTMSMDELLATGMAGELD